MEKEIYDVRSNYIIDFFLTIVNRNFPNLKVFCNIFLGGENVIYESIVKRCKARGISIMQLEKSCGLGNGTVAGWKNGNPRVDLLIRVADFFGITVDELIRKERE